MKKLFLKTTSGHQFSTQFHIGECFPSSCYEIVPKFTLSRKREIAFTKNEAILWDHKQHKKCLYLLQSMFIFSG